MQICSNIKVQSPLLCETADTDILLRLFLITPRVLLLTLLKLSSFIRAAKIFNTPKISIKSNYFSRVGYYPALISCSVHLITFILGCRFGERYRYLNCKSPLLFLSICVRSNKYLRPITIQHSGYI